MSEREANLEATESFTLSKPTTLCEFSGGDGGCPAAFQRMPPGKVSWVLRARLMTLKLLPKEFEPDS